MTRVKRSLSASAAKRSLKLVTVTTGNEACGLPGSVCWGLSPQPQGLATTDSAPQRTDLYTHALPSATSHRLLAPCSEPLWPRYQTSVSGSPRRLPVARPGRARPVGSRSRKGLHWRPVDRTLGVARWGAADPRQGGVTFVFRPGRALAAFHPDLQWIPSNSLSLDFTCSQGFLWLGPFGWESGDVGFIPACATGWHSDLGWIRPSVGFRSLI